ncbi:succinylglutamate desuccinylase, partial [Klebsiella pneumoniae]|nr:succinylglutamate desuccinylase [Klebsiella pneumoniae]
MEHFLALTLAGRLPHHFHGETAHFRWHWQGEGILELTPHARCERGLVLSCAIHGNETAPVEIVDQLVQRLVREALPLRWRLLVIVGNPPALRANKRYLHSDMNRMFGERWRQFPLSEETQRAQRLEQAVARFYRDHPAPPSHLALPTPIRGPLHPRLGVPPARHTPCEAAFLHRLAG